MSANVLEARGVSKSYEGRKIIENISVSVKKGEMTALLGISGIGKTTLFNVVSGLETPDAGRVYLNGEDVTGRAGKVGYMQQSDLLLPFKRVIDNAAIPLILMGRRKAEAREEAGKVLEEFGLGDYKTCYPAQLSGGMRQRAALARTFLYAKDALLLDEPFSALDAMTRGDMQRWFKNIVKTHNISTLLVTHDINEAILLSDRIYIMSGNPGRITDEFNVSVPMADNVELTEEFIALKRQILERVKA